MLSYCFKEGVFKGRGLGVLRQAFQAAVGNKEALLLRYESL
jgi:hypothetical protein